MRKTNANLFDLNGRVALVTGAASGIGLAISEILAESGATVVMTDVHAASLAEARERLASGGLKVHGEVVDVTEFGALSAALRGAHDRFGGLDVVCANAGISGGPGPLTPIGCLSSFDMQAWDRLLRINLTSVMVTIQTAAELMIPRGKGRILVTASIAGLRADPHVSYSYAATKAAVTNLVRQSAMELARHNVLVNAIAPGPFLTNIGNGRLHDEAVAQRLAQRTMLGRIGDPDEIKGLALLLCSDASSFMTGTVIPIDGGTTSW